MAPDSARPAASDGKPAADATPRQDGRTFPDPSLTLIEFSEALGLLLASRTEADPANRRVVLKKVVYIRLESNAVAAAPYAEVWIRQTPEKLFVAVDAATQKIFRDPSRRRYEVGFLSPDLFECALQCLKNRRVGAIFELAVVTFARCSGFGVEAGGLIAPDDYAAERGAVPDDRLVPLPPRLDAPKPTT